jgi:predicted O-methyltransferase YrrM
MKKKRVNTLPSLLKNISRFKLDEYIKVMVETSKSASHKIKNDIDFLFIDGSHTFESARVDYESWKEKIRFGGILTIHDIYDSEFEGGQAPREIYEKALGENFKLIKRVKSLVALEKVS